MHAACVRGRWVGFVGVGDGWEGGAAVVGCVCVLFLFRGGVGGGSRLCLLCKLACPCSRAPPPLFALLPLRHTRCSLSAPPGERKRSLQRSLRGRNRVRLSQGYLSHRGECCLLAFGNRQLLRACHQHCVVPSSSHPCSPFATMPVKRSIWRVIVPGKTHQLPICLLPALDPQICPLSTRWRRGYTLKIILTISIER